MRSKYMALISKQEKEMKCMIEYGERRLVQLDTELKANEIHINALEKKLKSHKVMPGIITPRTRSQYANFKKGADEKTRLEIKRGDVRRITKPPTPTPRKGDKSPISLFS